MIDNILKQYEEYDIKLIKYMKHIVQASYNNELIFEFNYLEKLLNISKYKQKQYIKILEDTNFLTYKYEGDKHNKINIFYINKNNDVVKDLKRYNVNEKQTNVRIKSFNTVLLSFIFSLILRIKTFNTVVFNNTLNFIKSCKITVISTLLSVLKLFTLIKHETVYIIYNNIYINTINKYIDNIVYRIYRIYRIYRYISINWYIGKRVVFNNNVKNCNMTIKRQKGLISIKKEGAERKLLNKNILMFPFKISGNKNIINYALQKIIMARQGLVGWEKVTNRDLACYLAYTTNCYLKNSLAVTGRAMVRGSQIIKLILDEQSIDKKDWVSISYYIVEVYKAEFNSEQYNGITWSFLENEYYRKELFKSVFNILENNKYNKNTNSKTKNEQIEEFKEVLGCSDELAEVQYLICNGYEFNNNPDNYDLKEWNTLCRKLKNIGGMVDDITYADEEKEKELLNKQGGDENI
ncbi:MAG: hypothetical protein ACOC1K_03160 [Nanoarchaeota archaeon]